ncbi:MAG: tyrosyl-tRNA synthetase [Dehalococcoidia bacterium]|nr:tyrosyl-tRNA synthetase [Dehalococcoidia bacterium]
MSIKTPSDSDTWKLLKKGVAEIISELELQRMLKASAESGKPLRLKQGFDPSRPDIHLGHVVGLRKLRQFQEMGHTVVLIVGDWTAQIGDPSGESVTRPMLSADEVRVNARTYMEQFFKVVDRAKTEVRWQSEWFGKFDLSQVIRLTSKFTVAQFLARDDFAKRYQSGRPIAITELLYPLLQAYDSVVVQSDVEFGGIDQKFNCLVGRELQAMEGQRPQQVFLMPLLVGRDGKQKMSKSLGNYIGVTEPPDEMYGKVMSIPDHLILPYFELVTDISDSELAKIGQELKSNTVNPMELKKQLAREIVGQFHTPQAALEAQAAFETTFQRRQVPENIPEFVLSLPGGTGTDSLSLDIPQALLATRMVKSRSEARRLIAQGALKVDGKSVGQETIPVPADSALTITLGKRRFARLKLVSVPQK